MHVFKDNFSKQSDIYLKYRPNYPSGLFAFLAGLTDKHDLAWDCGTGNGQAAVSLAAFFDSVVATDPSEQQIKNAILHDKVAYRVETSERNSLADDSVDLLTVANALHWFDFDVFYKEVNRVVKPNGIIAAWAYCLPAITPEIDPIVKNFHDVTLGKYWRDENRLVEKGYTTIPFPFTQIAAPDFFVEKQMNLYDFIGYLNTWSATQRFIAEHGTNPTSPLLNELKIPWKENNIDRKITWKLFLKVGRVGVV